MKNLVNTFNLNFASIVLSLIGLLGMENAQAVPVALELALLVDVSGSVDDTEYNLQKTGYVNAFKDPAIQAAIANLNGGLAVTYIEWSSSNEQAQLVGWTQITSAASSSAFADAIDSASRAFFGSTAPGSAINFATPLFSGNGFEGERWVIDVSGDGSQNAGSSTSAARDAFLATPSVGEGLTKTINGLPILGSEGGLEAFYTNNIQGGTNSFIITANNFVDFENAIRTKIAIEIQNSTVPEPELILLLAVAIFGMSFRMLKANNLENKDQYCFK